MSAFATLNLKNQAGTEVAFAPAQIDPSTKIARWLASGSSYDAKPSAQIVVDLPKNGSTRIKVKGKVSIPVMDPIDASKRIDENLCAFEFSLSKTSVLLDRQNLRAHIADFLTDAVVVAAIEQFEAVY